MPVVTVAAPAHADIDRLLASVADAVAAALALGPGDVLAVHVPTGPTVASTVGASAPWIVVTACGSDRGRERMDAARDAGATETRAWAARVGLDLGGVWTQWQLP